MNRLRLLASFIVSLCLLAAAGASRAQEVTRAEALRVAEAWVAHETARSGWDGAGAARVLDCREISRDGRRLGWWAPVAPRGHVIVPAVRALPAVKAFSTETDFDPAAEGGYTDLIKDVLELSLDHLDALYGDAARAPASAAPARHRATWDRLLGGAPPMRTEQVGPLLATDWHQSEPFNDYCPEGDGGTCVVGCVATAAAQILAYWRYPDYGAGTHTYQWPGDDSCGGFVGGGPLTANFDDAYDWDNILDSYFGGYTSFEAAAVAELCYEVGVAFDMDYGACGSGAVFDIAIQVLPAYFRFASGAYEEHRNQHTAETWWQAIRSEFLLTPPRPISYGIHRHAIVCDGILEEEGGARFYHMNYGWGGGATVWYALDDLYCPWEGCDVMVELMIVGLEPEGYFIVTAPAAGDTWFHGDPLPEIAWSATGADSVVLDLYRGATLLARICDWTPDDGVQTPAGAVDPAWGAGGTFRVRVVTDDGRFGWSEYFGIYAGGTWTDIATGTPLADAGRGQSVAWGDADGDGRPEIFLGNSLDGCRLFSNPGGAGWTDATAPPLDDTGYCRGAAWADADNDGLLDLYLVRTQGQANRYFAGAGGLAFTDAATPPLDDTGYGQDLAWGDYDNDGLADLYVVNVFAADRLLRNLGGHQFADVTAWPLGDASYGRSASWIDADGDGDQDLYLVTQAANHLYRNDGGAFTELYGTALTDGGDGFGAAWGDVDGDGDLDCYLVNTGANRLYRNDGGFVFTDITAPPLDDASSGRGAAWADYDHDGDLDLYLVNHGANHLLRNDGGAFTEATGPLLGDVADGCGAAWADGDGDGDLDLYLANDGAPNRLLANGNAGGRHWLQVALVGGSANRAGLGARIRVVAGGQSQVRAIGAGAGYLSRNDLAAHFGLGDADLVDSLVIDWPGGSAQALTAVAADQRLVVEQPGTPAGPAPAPARLVLPPNHPNPFNPRTRLSLELPAAARVDLVVFDLAGRRVRMLLADTALPAGPHEITWDGNDDQGHTLPSGIYLVRMEAADETATRKITLLK
ncbi:MAG: VCBS repeat-containing protein [Candidatus Krumholzibacteriota bacterium]|nr:VCBS repeat-containing protein [Candidatus Krumholzibacteriota bacterium]